MKAIKLICLIFVAITCVNCSSHSTAPKRIGYDGDLYGNIEQITITEHSLTNKFGEIRIDSTLSMTVVTFDTKGNVHKVEEYEPFITVIEEGTWNGTPLPNQRLVSLGKYTYDNDLLNKYEQYDEYGDLTQSILYSYDESDKLIEKTLYSSDSVLEYKIQYYYSGDLLTKVESSFYDTEYSLNYGKLEKSQRESYMETLYKYQYDKRNKLIHKDEIQYYKYNVKNDNCDTTVLSYEFDGKGNIILESRFDESLVSPNTMCKNYYNEYSMPIESIQLNDIGEIQLKYTFYYDKKNRLIEKYEYGSQDEFLCKWVCENDRIGNLVKSIKYEGVLQTPTLLVKVDIVYRK